MSKELSLFIEPNPIEAGDYSKKNLNNMTQSEYGMQAMGDNRAWDNLAIPTFDFHQGYDLTQNSGNMREFSVGNR